MCPELLKHLLVCLTNNKTPSSTINDRFLVAFSSNQKEIRFYYHIILLLILYLTICIEIFYI